jgi:outer membrane protein assembly factor BamB
VRTAPAPPRTTPAPPAAKPHPVRRRARPRKPVRLVITVVNGDTNRRVRGARVSTWNRHRRTDRHGQAQIRVPWSRPLTVAVRAPGYSPRAVPVAFRGGRKATIRIYRPALQWPLYGGDLARTGSQTRIGLRPPFRIVWSQGLGSLIEFPAVVSDGTAYIGNAAGTIRALSMRFGSILWRHDTPHGKLASSPAVVGREIVYHGMEGHVWVLDRATGRLRWHLDVGSPIESSPIVRNGIDYFGTWDGRIVALDLRSRRIRWTRSVGAKVTSSAALVGRSLYIGDYAGRIWSLYAGNGRTRWVGTVNGRIYGTPAVAGGRVFVPSSSGRSFSAFSTSGRLLWRRYAGAYVYSSPAVWGGRVFFGSYAGVFYCVSAATGATLWEVGTGGPISGAAVAVAGVAYAGSFSHRIVGVDVRSGRILMRFPHGNYVPVSGNGMRLLFHGYSRVYAVEPRPARRPRLR